MQHTASLVQTAASRRSPALVAGVGAAFVASGITLSVMMSGAAPATAPQQAADGSKNQCQVVHRAMLAVTSGGGGTIRLREGDYISPPIVLGPRAQLVNFPPDQFCRDFKGREVDGLTNGWAAGGVLNGQSDRGGSGAVRKECTKPFSGIVRIQVAFHGTSKVLTNGHLV